MSEKVVRVRVCVLVDNLGNWNAVGWSYASRKVADDDLRSTALEGLDSDSSSESLFWLEADLPIPQEVVVQAEVTTEPTKEGP